MNRTEGAGGFFCAFATIVNPEAHATIARLKQKRRVGAFIMFREPPWVGQVAQSSI
ncbi:MAG: hypothetical protein HKN10_10700 [Myxococcales bacterium]|nr:hypothetical protein [Myxococcales bacterium]